MQVDLLPIPTRIIAAESLADWGRPAVVLFFVLSGFVLAYNYAFALDRSGIKPCIVNRPARVYPVHLLSLLFLAVLVFGLTVAQKPTSVYGRLCNWVPSEHTRVGLASGFSLQLLLVQAWIPCYAIATWNGVT